DGGIPLWWPFSARMVGRDLLGLHDLEGWARFGRELEWFGWIALAGVAIGVWREARARQIRTDVKLRSLPDSSPPQRATWARSWPATIFAQGVWVWPIIALAGVHVYIAFHAARGDESVARGDWDDALRHYRRSVRLPAVDGISRLTLLKIAGCERRLGRDD